MLRVDLDVRPFFVDGASRYFPTMTMDAVATHLPDHRTRSSPSRRLDVSACTTCGPRRLATWGDSAPPRTRVGVYYRHPPDPALPEMRHLQDRIVVIESLPVIHRGRSAASPATKSSSLHYAENCPQLSE